MVMGWVGGATKFRLRSSKKLGKAGSNREANDSQFLLPFSDQFYVRVATVIFHSRCH